MNWLSWFFAGMVFMVFVVYAIDWIWEGFKLLTSCKNCSCPKCINKRYG